MESTSGHRRDRQIVYFSALRRGLFLLLILLVSQPLLSGEGIEIPAHPVSALIIAHSAYTIQYNEKYEQADWAAYALTSDMLTGASGRTDDFRPDPGVPTGSAVPADYQGSGYDKGHLVPANDMTFSPGCMSETFYMSNMSPQVPAFNRGIWKRLEELVRKWAKENGGIYIVTGPVLKDGGFGAIGPGRVAVPKRFFKVILDYREPGLKAVGFILPNRKSDRDPQFYAVPVDIVEEETGLDFFPQLPDSIEELLESRLELSKWFSCPEQVPASKHQTAVRGTAPHFWLNTHTGMRHNQGCRYFRTGKHGRLCGKNEGKPCSLCGG
jgi:endonuclease G